MKKNHPITLGLLLLFLPVISSAEDATDTDALLTALGAYLGYDLAKTNDPALIPDAKLLDVTGAALSQQSAVTTGLGAIPVNAANTAASQFVPPGSNYASINDKSNYTFSGKDGGHAYNTVSSSGDGAVSVTNLIDQLTYQNDPISQAVLNILGTPNYSVCIDYDGNLRTDCKYTLYNTQVTDNVMGTPLSNLGDPGDLTFFSYESNKDIISQLNSNTLLAPLLYTSAPEPPQPTGGTTTTETNGLPSTTPMQSAANFIRYVSMGITPLALPLQADYSNALAIMNDTTQSEIHRKNAKNAISLYQAQLRSYAAQQSVALGSLYSILSKRMPQQTGSDTGTQTSQALSEFQMATRRLYNPVVDKGSQWINQIDAASPATVQKEIVSLLAEINYQLYLGRQQDERQLLVSTIQLLQTTPQPEFDTSAATDATTPEAATTQ